jgi:hypothetical protein
MAFRIPPIRWLENNLPSDPRSLTDICCASGCSTVSRTTSGLDSFTRRFGGLLKINFNSTLLKPIFRRVGGSQYAERWECLLLHVFRRVGGMITLGWASSDIRNPENYPSVHISVLCVWFRWEISDSARGLRRVGG